MTTFLDVALQAAYLAILVAAAVRYAHRRSAVDADVLLLFATYAVVILFPVAVHAIPLLAVIGGAPSVALVIQPVIALRLLRHFAPFSQPIEIVSGLAGLMGIAIVLTGQSRTSSALVYFSLYFLFLETAVAARLWMAGRPRVGAARWRLRAAALATVLFAGTVLSLVAAIARAPVPGGLDPVPALAARVLALTAAGGYLVAFMPPLWLRNLQHRALAFGLSRDLVTDPRAGDPGRLWYRLLNRASDVLGTDEVTIRARDGVVLARGEPRRAGGGTGPLTDDPEHTARRVRVVGVPLDGTPDAPVLVATFRGTPLFEEDDLDLVSLLGSMTMRAVEREEALLGLAAAQASLAEARASEQAEIRFRALLDANPNGVLVADATGRIVYANVVAGDIFGYRRDALVGMTIEALLPAEHRDAHVGHREDYGDRPHARLMGSGRELAGVRSDGTAFPVEVALSPVASDGGVLTIAVVTDISERRAAEQVRESFLGMLSHELRTPVTGIYAASQLLLGRAEHMAPELRGELLGDIAAESERLQRMIENLIVLARVERGDGLERDRPIMVERLLPALLDRERALFPDATFDLELARPLPVALGDEDYVAQILRNLLSNAAKYARAGGPVEIEVDGDDTGLRIRVADRGPGFGGEDPERLFDLYFRATATSGTAPGAGVGLFVCRRLAEAMGGALAAEPRDGGGAVFVLTLPVLTEAAASGEARPAVGAARGGGGANGSARSGSPRDA